MSINTLLHKMVALKVIQWDLHWQDSPRLVQVFYYAIFLTAMQFNVSVLPCISQFLAPSICCWVSGLSGGGVTCRPPGRGCCRYNPRFKLHKSIVCTKPPSTELYITFDLYITAMEETKVVDPYIPSFPLYQSADSEGCIHLISQETENWVWKTLEIISLLISSHLEIKDIV